MAKRGGFPGGGGMGNMGAMMKQAQKMQAELAKAQDEIKDMEYEATAGGGMVKVVATGDMAIKSIVIDPEAVDPEDVAVGDTIVVKPGGGERGPARHVRRERPAPELRDRRHEHPRPDVGAVGSHVRSAVHPEAPRRA